MTCGVRRRGKQRVGEQASEMAGSGQFASGRRGGRGSSSCRSEVEEVSRDSAWRQELAGEVQDEQNTDEEAKWRCGGLLVLDGGNTQEEEGSSGQWRPWSSAAGGAAMAGLGCSWRTVGAGAPALLLRAWGRGGGARAPWPERERERLQVLEGSRGESDRKMGSRETGRFEGDGVRARCLLSWRREGMNRGRGRCGIKA